MRFAIALGAVIVALLLQSELANASGICKQTFPDRDVEVVRLCDAIVGEALLDKRSKFHSNSANVLQIDQNFDSSSKIPTDICKAKEQQNFIEGSMLAEALTVIANLPIKSRPTSVEINRAVVSGLFDLSNATIPYDLIIRESIFCGHLSFNSAFFERDLSILNSLVVMGKEKNREGLVSGINAVVMGDLRMNKTRAAGLILARAKVTELVAVSDSLIGIFSLNEGRAGRVVLRGTKLDKKFVDHLSEVASAKNWTDPDFRELSAATAGYPFIYNMLDLVDAQVSGELYADELMTTGPIAAQHAQVGNLRLRDTHLAAMDFRNANISRDIDLRGANIKANGSHKRCVFDRVNKWEANFVSFTQAKVGGNVILRHNRFTAGADNSDRRVTITNLACFNEMSIANDMDLSSLISSRVDLSGSSVGGAIELADSNNSAEIADALDISQATARWLRLAKEQVLPANTNLVGAEFRSLVVIGNEGESEKADSLLKALSQLKTSNNTFGSYKAVATTLTRMEDHKSAARIYIAREHRLTNEAGLFLKVWRWIQFILGGYGYSPINTVIAVLIATCLGAVVALKSTSVNIFLRGLQSTKSLASLIGKQDQKINKTWLAFDAIVFSLDRLIPLVSINGKHKEVTFENESWVRAYFVAHALMGYLLAATALKVISEAIGIS